MPESDRKRLIEEWFITYGDQVYNFLVYFTGSRDVEDLVQETFIRAMRGLEKYRGESNPKSWLIAIARNAAVDSARKKNRTLLLDELDDYNLVSEDKSPEEIAMIREKTAAVLALLQSFNPNYRAVILLRAMYGLSSAETASVLGWRPSRVNVTYHRARKIVQEHFGRQPEGVT